MHGDRPGSNDGEKCSSKRCQTVDRPTRQNLPSTLVSVVGQPRDWIKYEVRQKNLVISVALKRLSCQHADYGIRN